MRLTCARSAGGMLPQKKIKIQGFAGVFWSGFGTSELKVQLTGAHTCALTARASRIVSKNQRHGDGAKKERAFIRATSPRAERRGGL